MAKKSISELFKSPSQSKKYDVETVNFDTVREQLKVQFKFGITLLDDLLGGGFRGGRLVEIFGKNKSGKTELCRCLAEQWISSTDNGMVWYYDQEYALDPSIVERYPALAKLDSAGNRRFDVFNAETMEGFFERMMTFLEEVKEAGITNLPLLIILDSLASLKPASDMAEEDLEKARMPKQAIVLSALLPRFRRLLYQTGALAVFINQTRKGMATQSFVEDESPGGEAMKFYADYRLTTKNVAKFSFSKGKVVPKEYKQMGFFTKVYIKKNKVAIPDREVEVPVTYVPASGFNAGASDAWCLFYSLRDKNIIKTRGGRFALGTDQFDRKDWPDIYRASLGPDGYVMRDSTVGKAAAQWITLQNSIDPSGEESDSVEESD